MFQDELGFYIDVLADDFCEKDDQGELIIQSPAESEITEGTAEE